jgi:hypothetical protein
MVMPLWVIPIRTAVRVPRIPPGRALGETVFKGSLRCCKSLPFRRENFAGNALSVVREEPTAVGSAMMPPRIYTTHATLETARSK